jgi:hypothetical protein
MFVPVLNGQFRPLHKELDLDMYWNSTVVRLRQGDFRKMWTII